MAITYDLTNPKGLGLFDYLRYKGHWLFKKNGQWVSSNDDVVQTLIDEYVPNSPYGWNNFIALIFQDTDFNTVYNTATNTSPIIASSLTASMVNVREGIYDYFILIYTQMCTLGGATQTMKDNWANIASSIGLPSKFVAIVKS